MKTNRESIKKLAATNNVGELEISMQLMKGAARLKDHSLLSKLQEIRGEIIAERRKKERY